MKSKYGEKKITTTTSKKSLSWLLTHFHLIKNRKKVLTKNCICEQKHVVDKRCACAALKSSTIIFLHHAIAQKKDHNIVTTTTTTTTIYTVVIPQSRTKKKCI